MAELCPTGWYSNGMRQPYTGSSHAAGKIRPRTVLQRANGREHCIRMQARHMMVMTLCGNVIAKVAEIWR
jgi:hypothetical protein